jgi:hypothetical protein
MKFLTLSGDYIVKNVKILLTLFFLFTIGNVFAKEETSGNKKIYDVKRSDGTMVYYMTGDRAACFADSVVEINDNVIKLIRGRVWVTAARLFPVKVICGKDMIEINGATADVNAAENLLTVFNGTVFVSGKRVNKGGTINLKNHNVSSSSVKEPDDWQNENVKAETTTVAIEIRAVDKIKEVFDKKIREIIKNNYFTSGENEPEFLVKIEVSGHDMAVKGTITHVVSGKIIGIIDENKMENDEKNKLAEIKAIQIGNEVISRINSFMEDELRTGRMIVMEITDLSAEELDEFTKILSDIPGVKILKVKKYYDVKRVFEINYAGSGYDAAEIIKNYSVKNKKFDVWYVSGNNLKIKGITTIK